MSKKVYATKQEMTDAIDAAHQETIAAHEAFWNTHDRLVEQGHADSNCSVRWHPDYKAADARCIEASKAYGKATRGKAE
jgi:hypothetical protein